MESKGGSGWDNRKTFACAGAGGVDCVVVCTGAVEEVVVPAQDVNIRMAIVNIAITRIRLLPFRISFLLIWYFFNP